MSKPFRQAGAIVAALLAAFAILAVGQGLWSVLVAINIKLSPAVPWAALVMPVVLFGLASVLAGRGWPRWGATARRTLSPLAPVSRRVWTWSLVAGGLGVVTLAGLWTVMADIVRTPPNVLPDTRGVPPISVGALLLVSIFAAPVSEEIAFRGYAMGLLRREFGTVTALVIASVMFAAAHLNHGLYAQKLIVYLLAGLMLGVTALRSGSLLPAMVVHAFGDLVFFTTVWPFDGGRRLISEGGADAGFFATIALTVACSALWWVAFRRLLRATAPMSTDAARPAAALGAGAVTHA